MPEPINEAVRAMSGPQKPPIKGTAQSSEGLARLPRIAVTPDGAYFVRAGATVFAVTGLVAASKKPIVVAMSEHNLPQDQDVLSHRPKLDIEASGEAELRNKIFDFATSLVQNRGVYQAAEKAITVDIGNDKKAKFGVLLNAKLEERGICEPAAKVATIMGIIRDSDAGHPEKIKKET